MRPIALLLLAGLALSACGEAPRTGAEPRVQLKLSVPDDGGTSFDDRVEVRGTVTPADAAVRVSGEEAEVDGGEFRADVPLDPGGNVIDITATAPGRRPATDAVRVTRDIRVRIPDLVGHEVDQASDALGKLGLRVSEERGGSWLDRVIPGPIHVCATEPPAAALVMPRSTVTLLTERDC